MVRRVLSVLALLPLLLPPGLCVCHAPTAACTGGAAGHVDRDGHAPLAHLCLGHEGDGHRRDGHAPGCPAVQGVDHWTARPGAAVQAMDLDASGPIVSANAAGVPLFPVARLPRLDVPDPPIPLYLTLRTLLI
jgi:hypothetical protein